MNITVIAADANCDRWADAQHRPSSAAHSGGPLALLLPRPVLALFPVSPIDGGVPSFGGRKGSAGLELPLALASSPDANPPQCHLGRPLCDMSNTSGLCSAKQSLITKDYRTLLDLGKIK